jgi:hypothetical protein
MKAKTRELTGAALDWAVARCEGIPAEELKLPCWKGDSLFRYLRDEEGNLDGRYRTGPDLLFSSKWEAGGPIIERERIHVCPIIYNDLPATECWVDAYHPKGSFYGPTALIAAMRCYVASKMGEEIDIPRSLI